MTATAVAERGFAKLNLILHVGRKRVDGLHPLGSVFASIDLCDELQVEPADSDRVDCPGLDGPNLAAAAVVAFRRRVPELPPLNIQIDKRIPVAAGLGGGSAELGSDVPSQLDPRHALVSGTGEIVEPVELPAFGAVLVPQETGLSTAAVYAEFDRLGGGRRDLDLEALRMLTREMALLPVLANDLQPAVLALRPELARVLASLRSAGALGALVSGSGPTCFGLFEDGAAAETVAEELDGAVAATLRSV